MVYYMNNSENIILLIIKNLQWDISQRRIPHGEMKFYCAVPVDVPILKKTKSLLTRNSRCCCTFHFCVLMFPTEVDLKGGMGSGKDKRSPLAAVRPTSSARYFIVSYVPLVKYAEKKCTYCFTV